MNSEWIRYGALIELKKVFYIKNQEVMVEAAGIEPASANPLPLGLHA